MKIDRHIQRLIDLNQKTIPRTLMKRRDFLKISLTATGGLLLSWQLPISKLNAKDAATFQPSPFIRIEPDNSVTIWVSKTELGQGVRTSLPMIVADELGADWETVKIEQADSLPQYGDLGTGGSQSVTTLWAPLRRAGATAREMLITAAALRWEVETSACRVEKSVVINTQTGEKLSFGELAQEAARLDIPESPELKDLSDLTIIGHLKNRVDGPQIVTGKAIYGLDLTVPGMLYATIKRCPVYGGKLKSFDPAQAKAIPGVIDVKEIPPLGPGTTTHGGVAIIADNTWAALKGQEALLVEWDLGENARYSSESIQHSFHEAARQDGVDLFNRGDARTALSNGRLIQADYETAYVAHVPMETLNCTAHFKGDSCEVWVPSQAPGWAQWAISQAVGLPVENVLVHVTLAGGGFGRRLNPDFAAEAAQVSKLVGAPVKVVWTQTDSIQCDFFHMASLQKMSAALAADGYPTAWQHRIIEQNYDAFLNPQFDGTINPDYQQTPYFPYDIPHINFNYVYAPAGVKIGWWRSVNKQRHAFAIECFIDELAAAAGIDPLEYRLKLLEKRRELTFHDDALDTDRYKGVLKLAAEKADWGKPMAKSRALGIAAYSYSACKTYVAAVAEVSVDGQKRIKVHRVVCAVDCGVAINPDTIQAQFEGGITFGLSAVLFPPIEIKNGQAVQTNYDDYEIPGYDDAPLVEAHIVPSAKDPGGIGEPPVTVIAPAVLNALFALTGRRIRQIPVLPQDLG